MMSEDDWEEVERRLKVIGYPVILDCDGYRLAIYRARLKEMRHQPKPKRGGLQ